MASPARPGLFLDFVELHWTRAAIFSLKSSHKNITEDGNAWAYAGLAAFVPQDPGPRRPVSRRARN